MGFRFRKSVNFGPFRLNFSKSGVGYSVGGKGFRVTKTATGKTRTTASIPGTGISYVTETAGAHSSVGHVRGSTGGSTQAPAPKKPKKRKWPYIVGAILIIGVIGSTMGGGGQDDPSDPGDVSTPPTVSQVDTSGSDLSQSTEATLPEDISSPVSSQSNPQNTDQPTEATGEDPNSVEDTPQPTNPVQEDPVPTQEPTADPPVQSAGTYVGSLDSDKYHNPGCRFAENILPENEIWFDTEEEAQAAGYEPCGVCQ